MVKYYVEIFVHDRWFPVNESTCYEAAYAAFDKRCEYRIWVRLVKYSNFKRKVIALGWEWV